MTIGIPLVSIGLPVYNGESFLDQALESILSQTFEDFELIISDNASTDRTGEICKAYAAKDNRLRYFRNKKNIGAAKNFNRTFKLARGMYFKWAAADDLMAPKYLERCVEVLNHKPSVILCYPKTTLIDEIGQKICDYEDGLDLRSSLPHRRFRQFLRKPPGCNPVYGLMRRKVLCRTQLLRPYVASDYVLLAEMCFRGQFREVPERLFYRRNHPQMSRRIDNLNREFALWLDTSYRGKNAFPVLKLLFHLIISVKHAPVTPYEKTLCLAEIVSSTFTLSSRALEWVRGRGDPFWRRWLALR